MQTPSQHPAEQRKIALKILVHTRFYPAIGGIETVSWLLAHEWQRLGESVTVVSDVPCAAEQRREFPFAVHYQPGPVRWLRLMRWADVFVHMNISLKAFWPVLIVRRPFVAVDHTYYYSDIQGNRRWPDRLKMRLTKHVVNIAVSKAVAERIPARCTVIPNPVDLSIFQKNRNEHRSRDLVFLGRLVSDKGCDLLLRALNQLAEQSIRPSLTIIGGGPERPKLEQLVSSLNLGDQVIFAGTPSSESVAALLRQHRVMVVPSIWEESFGVVALEGAASGCFVIGSDGGGLAEAIGPAGTTFRRGDVTDLTAKISQVLTQSKPAPQDDEVAAHLSLHHPTRVAKNYLEVFQRACSSYEA
jgi:glycogen(starch) synthase